MNILRGQVIRIHLAAALVLAAAAAENAELRAEDGGTLVDASIVYDAFGYRASRTVSAGTEGAGSSTTDYWYGGDMHPLVVDRDGVQQMPAMGRQPAAPRHEPEQHLRPDVSVPSD